MPITKETNINPHSGHRSRIRARIMKNGFEGFEDYQILEYFLSICIPRRDTNELAHSLINEFGSLNGVLDANYDFLSKIDGVGESTALFLTTLPQLFQVYNCSMNKIKRQFSSTTATALYCESLLKYCKNEEMHILLLDNKSDLIKSIKVGAGTINQVKVTLRQITEHALKYNASAVVITHNHPNGNASPSLDDNIFTKTAMLSLMLNGISLLDHIIIASNGEFFSYFNSNLLQEYKAFASENANIKLACNPPEYK